MNSRIFMHYSCSRVEINNLNYNDGQRYETRFRKTTYGGNHGSQCFERILPSSKIRCPFGKTVSCHETSGFKAEIICTFSCAIPARDSRSTSYNDGQLYEARLTKTTYGGHHGSQ